MADTGSISAAAERLNQDASAVSRTIKSLEMALGGVVFFDRSIRPMKLTANGQTVLVHAREMLESHRQLLESIDADPMAMRGSIHVGFPPMVLQRFLLPFLMAFHKDYPEIVLKIAEYTGGTPVNFDTRNGRLDLICGYGADASHPNIVQIHYGNGVQIPCASPLYLEKHGTPQSPSDLINHTGVIFDSPLRPPVRFLQKDGVTQYLKWRDEIHFDSAGSAKTAALYGAGIHPGIPALHAYDAIAKGELVPVLTGWSSPVTKLYIYARSEAVRLKRVQVFIERYRAFMKELHKNCEKTLEPFCGEVRLGLD